ncbi:Blue (Type1) copper domain-containing protein [Nitrosotalea devaniterrae]|uniref:Blue (Type1) copper domain-containing protein n=1 Tax=Nitrosotalea devaniterrae TaxID=1078905 RepID=A0A128A3N9_9ARCH|nr:Blue (Type1) copper domain-containing protein [Candidatus Nitrosotalea devanaterra]
MEHPQMSDWDLMMPGMGLTAIGLAGVILSYLGIANTFLTGMQALSGLTMFIGMIFLSAGILSGGVSTSPRAKATTLVIFGIAGSVGAYAIGLNKVITSLPAFVGLLIIILIPTIVLAFFSMKSPKHFKPIATIFVAAMIVGVGSYTAFGFIGPGAQFHFQPMVQNSTNSTTPAATSNVPVISIEIPANASMQGHTSFNPDSVTVPKGDIIEWTNNDKVAHTVTSQDGTIWDSGIIKPGNTFRLDTSKLNDTTYQYLCTVHPFMSGNITIVAPAKPVFANVTITSGAGASANAACVGTNNCFAPNPTSIKSGTTVTWTNSDSVAHTVTSGKPSDNVQGDVFDSGLIKPGKTFQFTFTKAGSQDYFCSVHPWMVGKVTVG